MKKGLLSVVITTYCRNFAILKEAIDSVASQTYKNIEIIIVDDNKEKSEFTSNIQKGLKSYPDIVYYKMPKNSGACAARNVGILLSNGEFVAFLDDDDLWEKTKAEKQMKLFDDDKIGLVFCQGFTFDESIAESLSLYYTAKTFYPSPEFADMLRVDRIGSTSQAIIRKSVLGVCGLFDVELQARQDYEMWLRLTKNGVKTAGVPEPLFYHRMHKGEQISKVPYKALQGNKLIYKKYKSDFILDKRARFIILTTIAWMQKACAHPFKFFGYMVKSFFASPSSFFGELTKKGTK